MMKRDSILHSTARFLYNVFSDTYDSEFEKRLMSGGGGNSMFVNAWTKPSSSFIKYRISGEAKKRLKRYRYGVETMPHGFMRHNAKTIGLRRSAGKELHGDHNPSNVKVLQLIRDKVRSYKNTSLTRQQKLSDLEKFLANVQTLDIITIEQDYTRTHKDKNFTKRQKDMLSAKERDKLLNDTWEWIAPKNRSVY